IERASRAGHDDGGRVPEASLDEGPEAAHGVGGKSPRDGVLGDLAEGVPVSAAELLLRGRGQEIAEGSPPGEGSQPLVHRRGDRRSIRVAFRNETSWIRSGHGRLRGVPDARGEGHRGREYGGLTC